VLAACIGLLAAWALRHVENRQLTSAAVVPPPAPPSSPPAPKLVAPPAAPLPPPAPSADITDPAQLAFVIHADDSYVRLADDPGVRHGKYRLVEESTAVAAVRPADLPLELRAWQGREVLVDGACRAKITGFVMLARADGWPDFDGDGPAKWTAPRVASAGLPVLAGRLSACKAGLWAQAADQKPVMTTIPLDADRLLEFNARADLFGTAFADDLQQQWHDAGLQGDWRLEVPITTRIVEQASTKQRHVVLHAVRQGGCGDFDVGVIAVYRVRSDGTVERVTIYHSGLHAIEEVIEKDGQLMFIGNSGITSYHRLEDLTGAEKLADEYPFVGCPC